MQNGVLRAGVNVTLHLFFFFLVCLSDKIVILSWNCKFEFGFEFFFCGVGAPIAFPGWVGLVFPGGLDLHDYLGGFF